MINTNLRMEEEHYAPHYSLFLWDRTDRTRLVVHLFPDQKGIERASLCTSKPRTVGSTVRLMTATVVGRLYAPHVPGGYGGIVHPVIPG